MAEIKTTALKQWLKEINMQVYILVALFAMSSWIDINGMFVELPILVSVLPEGWNLPSYMTIIIQIANIGPIIYTILNQVSPRVVNEPPAVALIITIGAISCLMLAFFWDVTTYIGGVLHSTAFLILTGALAFVDCTSSVVYLPYMAAYKPQYLTALYVGESMSGMVPGIVGLIQGASGNPVCENNSYVINSTTNETSFRLEPVYSPPLFSVRDFFFILFVIMIISGTSFCCVHCLPVGKRERGLNTYELQKVPKEESISQGDEKTKTEAKHGASLEIELADSPAPANGESTNLWQRSTVILMIYIMWLNGLTNGVMPALQTYSVLPYGNTAFFYAVILSIIVHPLASLVALFVRLRSVLSVTILIFFGTVCTGYDVYLATQSPAPPLIGETSGEILAVISWVLMTAIFAFSKVIIGSILRYKGRRALLWCGIFTQIGSCIGAVISFVLINVLKLFTSKPPC